MTLRWALPGLFLVLLPSCHSLKVGRNAPTEGANPYELGDNAGYSQGGFYGDPSAAGQRTTTAAYPAEGQTFGAYGSKTQSPPFAATSDHAQVAPFSEGGYTRPAPTSSPAPRDSDAAPVSSRPAPTHKPVTAAAKKPSHSSSTASTSKKKSPALASTTHRSASHTTAGTSGGSVVKAVYHPPAGASASGKKVATVHRVHTVAPGDTLSKLASRYQVSVAAVKKQNHLDSDLIRIGQRLTID